MSAISKGRAIPKGITEGDVRGARVMRTTGLGPKGYAIFARDGRKLSGVHCDSGVPKDLLDVWRRKMARKERRCMKCEKAFPSEGPHNRMCKLCRSGAWDMVGGV